VILRSPLFVPGNKANMLEKALGLKPDAFVPDMEDSVPAAEKANARETIRSFVPRLAATGIPVIPRVNSLDTEWIEDDLAAVVGPDILGVSVGKVRTPADISAVSQLIGGPGGSITGAPKIAAMKIIEALEPQRRSVYCGSIGYVGFDGNMDTNIAIRTLVQQGDRVYTWAGGGVVADSNVDAEYQESLDKAAAILAVMTSAAR
jgi:hypothetical protein